MDISQNVIKKASKFTEKSKPAEEIKKGKEKLKEFNEKFDFRQNPEKIDDLSPEDIYNPSAKQKNYFFYWIDKALSPLGAVFTWSDRPYRNAADVSERLKELLKIVVDDEKSIAVKVDAPWGKISGFKGDKHIAKKIISSYYPKEIIPIFKTEHLKEFCRKLGISPEKESNERTGKDLSDMSLGEKWEFLNSLLMEAKRKIKPLKNKDNALFVRFLYDTFPVKKKRPSAAPIVPLPLASPGLLFEPQREMDLMLLFTKHHEDLGFPYIVKVSDSFPDMIVLDERGNLKTIEFEYRSSNFDNHGHDKEECDYIVCWVDDWEEPPTEVEIVSLKEKLEEL